jgi:hypothetical protein
LRKAKKDELTLEEADEVLELVRKFLSTGTEEKHTDYVYICNNC